MKQWKRVICTAMALALAVSASGCQSRPISTDNPAPIVPEPETTFTIGWVSDPQWYSFKYFDILTSQNDWIVENFENENMKYIVHTGDFVDLPHATDQWEFVSEEYTKWDEAGIPYGVLAGNHDVDGADCSEFQQYFGEARYADNEWYGESYDDNRGHYDLMTLGGVDFIFVYLGYGEFSAADYDWLNTVLGEHPTHIAVLSFHEYLVESGMRAPIGETIFEDVVLKNPNVRMVLCGHNYNATRRVDDIDDNGDGVVDRQVYQMMANYQDLENGGNGFFRMMDCDVTAGTIASRTYSPYLNTYNAFENSDAVRDEYGYQDEFTIPFDFSAPAPKAEGDPEKGTVVINSRVAFGGEDGSSVVLPLAALNEPIDAASFRAAAAYDRHFSLTATDVCDDPAAVDYITVTFEVGKGYHVESVVKGADLEANAMVPIPQTGYVIVVAQNARDVNDETVDIDTVEIGHAMSFSQVYTLVSPDIKRSTNLVFPWGATYGIHGNNRKTGADQWILIDAKTGDSTADLGEDQQWNRLYAFAPTETEDEYAIVETATASGTAKELAIPENGFVLSINSESGCPALGDSMEAWFIVGTTATLNGYTPTVAN